MKSSKSTQRYVTPPLHWLRAFEAAARHLSFTHAAQELCLTQSAVSKQVRLLESHMGMQLFLREHRSLRLTEAGRNYLPVILRAFQSLEQGTRSFLGYSTERLLHIKANYSFATFWLGNHIHEFMDLYPDVRLTVSTALWEQDFSGSVADVEIHYGKKELFADHAVQLTEEQVFPVCTPTIAKRLKRPRDLNQHRILDLTGIRDTWDYWLSQVGSKKLDLENRHYLSTFVLAINMARKGQGITLGHSSLIEHILTDGELCKPLDLSVTGRDHYFVQSNQINTQHPAASNFVNWIVNKMAAK